MARSQKVRARMVRSILRRRVFPERAMAKDLEAWLDRTKNAILARLRRGASFSELITEDDGAAFQRLQRRGLSRAIETGKRAEAEWIELNGRAKARQQKQEKGDSTDWERLIFVEMSPAAVRDLTQFLDGRTVGIWSRVSETMRRRMAEELRKSIADGDTLRERTRRVQEVLGGSKAQAVRIARTETVAGTNAGQQAQRTTAEIDFKEWSSVMDDRTREGKFNHLLPDMQIQPNDKPFIISGERLMFPGDISLGASGGNVIQCRCASVAAFPDDLSKVGILHPEEDEQPPAPPVSVSVPEVILPPPPQPEPPPEPPAPEPVRPKTPPWRGEGWPRKQKREVVDVYNAAREQELPETVERMQT